MILTRLQIGLAASVTGAMALVCLGQMRINAGLRAETSRQSATAVASFTALEGQVAAQAQRLRAAEASLTDLLASAKAASAARLASPTTVDTKDRLNEASARARQLIAEGKPQEALEEYVSCYRELQAIRPGSSECQSLMTALKNLSRNYPPALAALTALRDAAMAQRQTQPDRRELISEIAQLNERLGEGFRTIALYDSLPADRIERQGLALTANKSFIEARRYAEALEGRGLPEMLRWIDGGARMSANQEASLQARMRASTVAQTLTDIEVLTGAGKADDARLLTEKLLALDNSDATRAALQQHLDRARRNP